MHGADIRGNVRATQSHVYGQNVEGVTERRNNVFMHNHASDVMWWLLFPACQELITIKMGVTSVNVTLTEHCHCIWEAGTEQCTHLYVFVILVI